jgi:hypothetical protein
MERRMKIIGTEGLTSEELTREIRIGAKFVIFEYAISLFVVTLRRSSDIYFVRAGESAVAKGLPYTLLSLFLGWWGVPWGLIYTPMALVTNLSGGKDVTPEVRASLLRR